MIIIYFIFYVIFLFLEVFLSFYVMLYSVIILFYKGINENNNDKFNELYYILFSLGFGILLGISCVFSFLVCSKILEIISLLLDLNNKENNNLENIRNINEDSENDLIKKGYLYIGDRNIEVGIIANKNIYLEEHKTLKDFIFKKVLLRDSYIYFKIKNEAIKNMLSITDWIFPQKDEIYEMIYEILNNTIGLFTFLSFLFFFHANDDDFYIKIKKNLQNDISSDIDYKGIFIIFGNFEKTVNLLKFYYYLIILFILLTLMFKRIFYGGYILLNYKYFYILSIIFFASNILLSLLTVFLIVFSVMCKDNELNNIKKYSIYETHTNIFYIHYYFNIMYIIPTIIVIYKIYRLIKHLKKLKNDYDNLYISNGNENNQNEFKYIGRDLNYYSLNEIQIRGFPRNLLYIQREITIIPLLYVTIKKKSNFIK